MATFAVMLRNRGSNPEAMLMLLDERREADEIAFELRRHGQDVTVREVRTANGSAGKQEWVALPLSMPNEG